MFSYVCMSVSVCVCVSTAIREVRMFFFLMLRWVVKGAHDPYGNLLEKRWKSDALNFSVKGKKNGAVPLMRRTHENMFLREEKNRLGPRLSPCGTPLLIDVLVTPDVCFKWTVKRRTDESVRHTNLWNTSESKATTTLVGSKSLKHSIGIDVGLESATWRHIVPVVCQQWLAYKMELGYFQTPCLSGLVRGSLKGHDSLENCLFPAHGSEKKLLLILFPRFFSLSQNLLFHFIPFFFHSRSKLKPLINSVYLPATHSPLLGCS